MTSFSVSNVSQLHSALATARGGDTISLAPGNYGHVSIWNKNYSSNVTILSEGAAKAHFDTLVVDRSSNLTFQGLDVGRGLRAGESSITKLSTVASSSNIKILNSSFHGSLDSNPGNDGVGLYVNRVTGFELHGSSFEQVYRGVAVQQSSGVKIHSSKFDEIRSDGITVAAAVGINIESNYFTDFRPISGDHADVIQFWNVGQPYGSRDITIKGNVVMNGTGQGPQGIFIADANGFTYRNINIENNLIYSNDSYHGIYINGADGVKIVGNSTLSTATDADYMWMKLANVRNGVISDNLTERLIVEPSLVGVTQSDNKTFWAEPGLRALLPNLNFASKASELIIPGIGYQMPRAATPPPAPAPTPKPSPNPPASDPDLPTIYGSEATWETVRGTDAAERVVGVSAVGTNPGQTSRDILYGGGGADLFVLGDARGLFYDDDAQMNPGRLTHAAILDFDADDRLQFVGHRSDYIFRVERINGILGTSVFRDDDGNGSWGSRDEFIAHVSGSSAATTIAPESLLFLGQFGASASANEEAARFNTGSKDAVTWFEHLDEVIPALEFAATNPIASDFFVPMP